MPTLLELQKSIRRSVLQDPDREPDASIVGGELEPGQRLSVYRNTILGTLAKALRLRSWSPWRHSSPAAAKARGSKPRRRRRR